MGLQLPGEDHSKGEVSNCVEELKKEETWIWIVSNSFLLLGFEISPIYLSGKAPEAVKRTDSIQSKRKVSSLSDRSDTSEPGGAEGSEEESPGVLSDEQPPESPNDSNDIDDTSKNMPWLKVITIPKIEMLKYFTYLIR